MTTIYLIRHSIPFRKLLGLYNANEEEQLRNEKNPLSVEGELLAAKISKEAELQNIDVVYSSNYVRAMATAKYIAEANNTLLNVDERFGERKFGVKPSELPEGFERRQLLEEDYKLASGESQKEVRKRMYEASKDVLEQNKDKRIAIVSHGTAISFLLKEWCDIDYVDEKFRYSYKGNILLHNYFNHCETFKLEFDNNELISIERLVLY